MGLSSGRGGRAAGLLDRAVEFVDPDVRDVANSFGEQNRNVVVVEAVDHLVAAAGSLDEIQVAKLTKLMRNGGGIDAEHRGKFVDRRGCPLEAGEDPKAGGRGQRLHRLRDVVCELALERRYLRDPPNALVAHVTILSAKSEQLLR